MSRRSFDDANSLEARQFLLDNRDERLHPKRHRTAARSKRISKKKRQSIAMYLAKRDKTWRAYKDSVRAYWAGAVENHP